MKTSHRPSVLSALVAASAIALAASPARAEGETSAGPCDALLTHLRGALAGTAPAVAKDLIEIGYRVREKRLEAELLSTSPLAPPAYTALVTPECRAETRLGAAPAAAAAAREWTERPEPGWIDRGRILLCTMQDPASLEKLAAWMADDDHPEARAVCASQLATWPGAAPVRGPIFARALRRNWRHGPRDWEIDPAVVAAAGTMGTPDLREQLVSTVVTALARQADGYDRLRDAVCMNDRALSADRAQVCSSLPTGAESEWQRQRRRTDRWEIAGTFTLSYAGLVASAYFDHRNGRGFATAGGALAGALVVGSVVGGTVGYATGEKVKAAGAGLAGTIAGGVLGGLLAHRLATSPGTNAAVTAVGFAPLCLMVWTLPLN